MKEGKTPKLVTRSGQSVRLVCVDRNSDPFTMLGLVDEIGREIVTAYTKEGYFEDQPGSDLDLFFADIEPTYRPYKDTEECFKDVVKHGGWVKEKETNYYVCIGCVGRLGVRYADSINETYGEFLQENVWADDGTPCGVKEEEV